MSRLESKDRDRDFAGNINKMYRIIQGLLVYQAQLYSVSLAYADLHPDFGLLILLVLCHVTREFQDVRIVNLTNVMVHCRKAAECQFINETLCRMSSMQRVYLSNDQLGSDLIRALKNRSSSTLELLSIELSGECRVPKPVPFASLFNLMRQCPRIQMALAIDNIKGCVEDFAAIGTRALPISHLVVRMLSRPDMTTLKVNYMLKLIISYCACSIGRSLQLGL